uniref:Large ribosomal subunit protein eL24 n=1 Tax=Sus scrofa TaxID=9823 RepID=A0A8D0XY26_PIG
TKVKPCSFRGYKIYPGPGRHYARTDGKVFQFLNAKCESAFLSKRNPPQINRSVLYRRKHKKGQSEEIRKKRTYRTVKFKRCTRGCQGSKKKKKKKKKKAKQASKKTAMAASKAPTEAAPKQKIVTTVKVSAPRLGERSDF